MITVFGKDYKVYLNPIIEEKSCNGASLFLYDRLKNITLQKRRNEIVTTGFILNHIFKNEIPTIAYDDKGKPYFTDKDLNVSISHCKNRVAVGLSGKDRFIGVDVETISAKPLKLAEKFINENDEKFFEGITETEATLVWTIKEAVYKADNSLVNFKESINLKSVERMSKFRGKVLVNDDFVIDYYIFDDFILSVAIKNI